MELIEIEKDHWIFPLLSTESAQDEFYRILELLDAGRLEAAEARLLALIEVAPNHIDAIHHLALVYEEQGRDGESCLCRMAAVGIGLDALPEKFSWKKSRLEWGFLENRPFMRAYHSLGLWRLEEGEYAEAARIFSRLMQVCPNDNLGARYLLIHCTFATGKPAEALSVCRKYRNDVDPEITFSRPLALILTGETETAKPLLAKAVQELPLVGKELLKKRHPKPKDQDPDYITFGGHDQAYDYWSRYGRFWTSSSVAMELLEAVVCKN